MNLHFMVLWSTYNRTKPLSIILEKSIEKNPILITIDQLFATTSEICGKTCHSYASFFLRYFMHNLTESPTYSTHASSEIHTSLPDAPLNIFFPVFQPQFASCKRPQTLPLDSSTHSTPKKQQILHCSNAGTVWDRDGFRWGFSVKKKIKLSRLTLWRHKYVQVRFSWGECVDRAHVQWICFADDVLTQFICLVWVDNASVLCPKPQKYKSDWEWRGEQVAGVTVFMGK